MDKNFFKFDIDDAVDMIEEMPANIVERILKFSTKETRTTINKFLKYEENTINM